MQVALLPLLRLYVPIYRNVTTGGSGEPLPGAASKVEISIVPL